MNSCEIKNTIDRAELLQRLDLRIRAMCALMESHEKYIVSLSASDERRDKLFRTIERENKRFLDSIAKVDNEAREHFNKLRQEYNVSEETE